jgi:peroxiredoxin
MSVKIEDKASGFNLLNQDAEKASLDSFKGKNVEWLFFPLANTAPCTKEMCTFRDELKTYEDLDAQILGVSVDSPFALKLWQEKNNYNFPLLSDFNKEAASTYDAIHDVFVPGKLDLYGMAKRSALVIDKDSNIKYVEILDDPGNEPSYENIQNTLKELK